GGRVRSAARFSNGHGAPLRLAAAKPRQKSLTLLRSAGRHYCGATKTGIRNAKIQTCVSPREFLDEDGGTQLPLGWLPLACGRLFLAIAEADQPLRSVPHHGEPFHRFLVLALVVLTRNWAHGGLSHHVDHVPRVFGFQGEREVDHEKSPKGSVES